MRNPRVIVLVVVLMVAGVFAFRQYRKHTESPFVLGYARAGQSYSALDAKLTEAARTDRSCVPIAAGYRICRGTTLAPQGDMTVVVDDRGRIAVLRQRVTELSDSTKQATSALLAAWNDENPGVVVKRAGQPDSTHWLSDDTNWSATMTLKRGAASLSEVVLTDERSIAAMNARTLPALLVLSREGLVSAGELDGVEQRRPGALARAAESLAATGRPLGDAAARLPACDPQPSLGIDAGMARRAALGESAAQLVTLAMAQLDPARRLELRDSVYLVDSAGVPELIDVTAPVALHGGTAYAFAVSYLGRAAAVGRNIQAFDAASCRAPAEVIVAKLDRSRTRIASIDRFVVDDESLASRVVGLRVTGDAKSPRLAVSTVGTYGASDWYGEVDWLRVADPDSLRVVESRPTALAKMDVRQRVAAVDLQAIDGGSSRAPSLAGRRVNAVVQSEGASSAHPIVLPAETGGRASGWAMLTVL